VAATALCGHGSADQTLRPALCSKPPLSSYGALALPPAPLFCRLAPQLPHTQAWRHFLAEGLHRNAQFRFDCDDSSQVLTRFHKGYSLAQPYFIRVLAQGGT
jgi:hypothetical protein